ncbi:hypothetical protein XENORESO_014162 [Xenotaenia resolanae]|uniref:Uncharacterized protein n=1 Tax=Xenotaenia resolanae TaxID=208358 RepID=A0ABV0VT64_9TELE
MFMFYVEVSTTTIYGLSEIRLTRSFRCFLSLQTFALVFLCLSFNLETFASSHYSSQLAEASISCHAVSCLSSVGMSEQEKEGETLLGTWTAVTATLRRMPPKYGTNVCLLVCVCLYICRI